MIKQHKDAWKKLLQDLLEDSTVPYSEKQSFLRDTILVPTINLAKLLSKRTIVTTETLGTIDTQIQDLKDKVDKNG